MAEPIEMRYLGCGLLSALGIIFDVNLIPHGKGHFLRETYLDQPSGRYTQSYWQGAALYGAACWLPLLWSHVWWVSEEEAGEECVAEEEEDADEEEEEEEEEDEDNAVTDEEDELRYHSDLVHKSLLAFLDYILA